MASYVWCEDDAMVVQVANVIREARPSSLTFAMLMSKNKMVCLPLYHQGASDIAVGSFRL